VDEQLPLDERFPRLTELQVQLGCEWCAIRKGIAAATKKLSELATLFADSKQTSAAGTSFVCFGSLARGEWTFASDLDWILLVNGDEAQRHGAALQALNRKLNERNVISPAAGGMFAAIVNGQELIAGIPGHRSVRNLSLRSLLLLESIAIGDDLPMRNVIRNILAAYLEEDSSWNSNRRETVPEYLLQDIAAFGRTMAVDLDDQFPDQTGQKWGLRNAKRRFSRKLIIATGSLACWNWRQHCADHPPADDGAVAGGAIEYFKNYLGRPPLEILAAELLKHDIAPTIAARLFGAYNRFLGILDDTASREELELLNRELASTNILFQEVCEFGREFDAALRKCFLLMRPAACNAVPR